MARRFDRHAFPNPKIKLSPFYFANGTYADLWHGHIDDDEDVPAVAVKVWRARLPCNTLRDVEKVRKLVLVRAYVLNCYTAPIEAVG